MSNFRVLEWNICVRVPRRFFATLFIHTDNIFPLTFSVLFFSKIA